MHSALIHNDSMIRPKQSHRLSVPMSEDVFQAFQEMASVLGRSTGSTVAEWLNDTLPAAISATEQMRQIRRSSSVGLARVEAMVEASELLTSHVLDDAQKRSVATRSALAKHANRGGADPLTPPSSNTGGKVGKQGKTPKGSK